MKAELLFHQRIDYDDGAIVEMVCGGFRPRYRHQRTASNTHCSMDGPVCGKLDMTTNAARAITDIFEELSLRTGSAQSSN
jgi:hypothetical protein